jgi:hypothetical protein
MGDMADLAIENGLTWDDFNEDDRHYDAVINQKIWETKEGQKIPVSKLGDSHLINIVNMGLGDHWLGDKPFPCMETLLAEIEKRGLVMK